jgi:hypothetical protein
MLEVTGGFTDEGPTIGDYAAVLITEEGGIKLFPFPATRIEQRRFLCEGCVKQFTLRTPLNAIIGLIADHLKAEGSSAASSGSRSKLFSAHRLALRP